MDGRCGFFLPEGGVPRSRRRGNHSGIPKPTPLFRALDQTVPDPATGSSSELKRNINEPEFAAAIVAAFHSWARQHAPAGGEVIDAPI